VTRSGILALTAALTLLSGCAAAGSDPTAAPPVGRETASVPPAPAPASTPPSDPTDEIKPTEVVVGTVNRGGTGPCYGLVTDDGVQYALYEDKGRALTTGLRIEAATAPTKLRIDCGAGTLVEVKALKPLR
jgi:hypothetical protein